MQQFTVPQFIDVEDKIIGPITTRQFVIILVGCLLGAAFYKLFDFSLFLLSFTLIFTICIVVAFVKINGRPFHFFLLNAIQTLKRSNLRIWINNHDLETVEAENVNPAKPAKVKQAVYVPPSSRLDELSLIVDTQGAYKGEANQSTKISITK